ncbi:MAG: hypothetical protein ACFFD4_38620, partial [Candidatus Odinarchaeota archaeon]
ENFYVYEGLAGIWSAILVSCIGIFWKLLTKTPTYKDYIWKRRINSLSKRFGYDITYVIHRNFTLIPRDTLMNQEEFSPLVESVTSSMHVKKIIKKGFNNDIYEMVVQLNSGILAEISVLSKLSPYDVSYRKVSGFRLHIKSEGKFRQLDKILRDNDSLLRSLGNQFERSLSNNKLQWEVPFLEISPVKHFIRDSYFLSQRAEESVITIRLEDGTIASLGKNNLTIRIKPTISPELIFIDDQFTRHIQQSIATFYNPNSAS